MRVRVVFLASLGLIAACAEAVTTPYQKEYATPDSGRRSVDAGLGADAQEATDGAQGSDDAGDGAVVADAGDAATASDASDSGTATIVPPVADGVVSANEYGVHTDGQNQQTSDVGGANPAKWYMTWDETNLYVAVTSATVTEAVVLYVDTNPLAQLNAGTNGDGTLVGYSYDMVPSSLPIRADFVAYVKSTYNEYRRADGNNGWGAPTTAAITNIGTGTTRELVIPWVAIRPGGRPPSFAWTGYVVSNSSKYVYAEMPPANPGPGTMATEALTHAYLVGNATPGTGTKPFANAVMP
jgi:hypothetical protein